MISPVSLAELARLDLAIGAMEARHPDSIADNGGWRDEDWTEHCRLMKAYGAGQRRRALRVLWGKPVVGRVSRTGLVSYQDNRDEEWTVWRAVVASVAIVLQRYSTDASNARLPKRQRFSAVNIAYWDAGPTYGGYDVQCLTLAPRCRFSIFSDGECLM